jgi:hypothetical protein
MTDSLASSKTTKRISLSKCSAYSLCIIAVTIACILVYFTKAPIPITTPLVLLFASAFLMMPFRNHSIALLQRIIGIYLVAVLVNELSLLYLDIRIGNLNINMSYSTCIVAICFLSFLVSTIDSDGSTLDKKKWRLSPTILAIAVILIHMLVLLFLLKRFYGYGYEHNIKVLGHICQYLLVAFFLWDKFNNIRFRQCVGLTYTIFSLAYTIKSF